LFVGKVLSIYNGKRFVNVQISEEMVGFKAGEFVSTRKKPIHKKK
jgi:ribosomal protein S19